MEEKQIIAQLKELRTIKPDQQWQKVTKFYIAGSIQPRENTLFRFSRGFLPSLFQPARLAPALISLVIIILVGTGIAAHFYLNSPSLPQQAVKTYKETTATYLVLAETKLNKLEKPEDIQEIADILAKATEAIPATPKNPAEAEKLVKSIVSIRQKVQELEQENPVAAGELKKEIEVLTSITTDWVKEGERNTNKELVKNLIEYYGTRSLTDEQAELFKQAEIDYNNGDFAEALIKIYNIKH